MHSEDKPPNLDKISSARQLAEALEDHRRRQHADAVERAKGLSDALLAYREKNDAEIQRRLDALIAAQKQNTTDNIGEAVRGTAVVTGAGNVTVNPQTGQLRANVNAFEFSAVGSVSQAMHTARAFDDGPVLELITASTPHALVALKEKAIKPERFSFIRPDDFTEDEFVDVVASYSGAELLDRERQQQVMEKTADRTDQRRQTALKILIPIVTALIGATVTYLKITSGG
jgi:hypothetical protein